MLSKEKKIYVSGHNGMVGSACVKLLNDSGYNNLVYKKSTELDLTVQADVKDFINDEKPYAIINAAAKVGGILANDSYPYEFLIKNLQIQNNLINSAHNFNISKFIFLGSSCIYPKLAKQPLKESYLLSGDLEPTNQWYAIAKISGVKLIESLSKQYNRNYVSLMPTNLYGTNDNFDLNSSHVLPALLRKFHEAKYNNKSDVTLWGTGKPLREFLHVNDLANAILFTLENDMEDNLYNVGSNEEISIYNLSNLIKEIIGFNGNIKWDKSKPDGTPRKLLDSSKLNKLGWTPKISLDDGILSTYRWYLSNYIEN